MNKPKPDTKPWHIKPKPDTKPWHIWWHCNGMSHISADIRSSGVFTLDNVIISSYLLSTIDVVTGRPFRELKTGPWEHHDSYTACGQRYDAKNWMTHDFEEVVKWKGVSVCGPCVNYSRMTYDAYVKARIAEHDFRLVEEIMGR